MGFTSNPKRSRQQERGVPMTSTSRILDPRPATTVEDALLFVADLKRTLGDADPDRYYKIINVMSDFRIGSVKSAVVLQTMKVLLEDHPSLLREFNQFLPWGYIRAHGALGGFSV